MPENGSGSKSLRRDELYYHVTVPQQMAASCSGALLTSVIVTPFDVVKTRLQAQQKTLLSNKCYLYCNGLMDHLCPCVNSPGSPATQFPSKAPSTNFTGTIDAFAKIMRSEGVGSLWSGLSPTLVLAVPLTVVYFTSYEQLRHALSSQSQSPLIPFVAGVSARAFSVTLVSPLELVRTKMQSRRLSYVEIGQALKNLYTNHGILGFWRGLGSTLLRDVPFSGIYWLSYETLKKEFASEIPSAGFAFFAGAVSGSVAALVTTPFDVVKTHQQIDLGEKEIFSGTKRPTGAWSTVASIVVGSRLRPQDPPRIGSSMSETMRNVYERHGIRGLFAGLTPRLVKVAPACAIMISSFEYGKAFFRRYNARSQHSVGWQHDELQ